VKKKTATIVMVLLASVMGLVIVGVCVIAWIFVSVIDRTTADEPAAVRAFDAVRDRFDRAAPLVRLEESGPVVTRRPPAAGTRRPLSRLNVLAWDAEDGKLTKATVPFWLVRLKESPLELSAQGLSDGTGLRIGRSVKIRVADVERYGPSLLLDEHHGSDRVLVWTD
jgi:hypothetical protein